MKHMDRLNVFAGQSGARTRQKGVTLVELMVALVIAGILSVAVLSVLGFGFHQDAQSTDLTSANNSARTAMTLIGRDLQSAGFMLGAAGQSQCALSLSYNSNSANPYQINRPVQAASAPSGSALPAGIGAVSSYPQAGNTNSNYVGQSIAITAAPSALSYFQNTSEPVYVVQFGTTQSGSGQGALNSTNLPTSSLMLSNTQGLASGDMAYLNVPMNGANVCLRIPITNITGGGSGVAYISSKNATYMPPNGYQDYAAQIPASYGVLNNSNLLHARIVSLGNNPTTLQILEYNISTTINQFPVLMRSDYSALTDQIIGSPQAVAPGVVSLQILFGTLPNTATPGQVNPVWKTQGDVLPTDQVVSVDIGLVIRSLHEDTSYTAPAQIVLPQPDSGLAAPDAFSPYIVQPGESHHHFWAYTQKVQMRNLTWQQ